MRWIWGQKRQRTGFFDSKLDKNASATGKTAKKRQNRASNSAVSRLANPGAGLATDAARVAPSPWGEGRDEGGR